MTLDGTVQQTPDGGFVVAFDRPIDRPPAKVWAALTDTKVLANWLGEVELDLRIGGPYIIRFRRMAVAMTGTITALDPGRMLEYIRRENYGMAASKVRWEVVLYLTLTLEPRENNVLLVSHTCPCSNDLRNKTPWAGILASISSPTLSPAEKSPPARNTQCAIPAATEST